MAQDLSANNIAIGAQTFKPTKDIKLNGATAINGSTIDLSSANITLAGNQNSRMIVDVTINTNFADGKIGHLIVDGQTTKLDAAANRLNIHIKDTKVLPITDISYTLICRNKWC